MIRAIILTAGLSLGASASAPVLPANIPPIQADSLIRAQSARARTFRLVDIRTPEEFGSGHIKGSSQMDFRAQDFRTKLEKLPRDGKILIYCRSGHRSGMALRTMQELGFLDAHEIAGGIEAWRSQGLPLEP